MNSLLLNTFILGDKTCVFHWKYLTLPLQIPQPSQARFKFSATRAQTAVKCPWLAQGEGKTKQKKLNNSRLAEFFASLRSFPILSFQSSIPVTVFFSVSTSLFCESNKYVDYWHDKPNKPKNKKRNKEKTPPNV